MQAKSHLNPCWETLPESWQLDELRGGRGKVVHCLLAVLLLHFAFSYLKSPINPRGLMCHKKLQQSTQSLSDALISLFNLYSYFPHCLHLSFFSFVSAGLI